MAILSERDAVGWHALGGRIATIVEARLADRVLANRALRRGSGWELEPVDPALSRARSLARRLAGRSAALIRTDVADFYASVQPGVLADSLRRAGVGIDEAHRAAAMLDGWGSEGYPGLPIGPPGSAVMANAVLRRADQRLSEVPFLRWVDDYLVGCGSTREASGVLERLDGALAVLGLQRSFAKTGLLDRSAWAGWLLQTSRLHLVPR